MLEGQLLEGPGTYQGGQKGQQTVDKKSLQKRKANMKRDRQVLNRSTDILNRVFSDDESLPTPRQPKTATRTRRGRRVSAAASRLVDNPTPDVSQTPKRRRGNILL